MLRILTLALCFLPLFLFAQMPDGNTVRYGNEWINPDREYLRVEVAEDGMYRLPLAELTAAGIATDGLELRHEGRQTPFRRTADAIVFYGQQHRKTLDRFLFVNPDSMMLNDRYSMYNDTAAYYFSNGDQGIEYRTPQGGGGAQVPGFQRSSEVVFERGYAKSFFRSGSSSIFYSSYELGEGYGLYFSGDLLDINGTLVSTAELEVPQATGADGVISWRTGLGFDTHEQIVTVNGDNLTEIRGNGWSVLQQSFPLALDREEVTVTFTGNGGNRDRANLAWVRIDYPANPVLDGDRLTFSLPAGPAGNLTLTDDAGGTAELYVPAEGLYWSATTQNGQLTFSLPARTSRTTFELVRPTGLRSVINVEKLELSPILPDNNTTYLILTTRSLNGSGIEELSAYRASAAGGGYQTHVVDVEDIYEQFGYGVERHPQSMRNYLAAARVSAPELRYLFIIGKGREIEELRKFESAQATFRIPGFGFPASDNLLVAPLGGVVPTLSVGRLAALTESEVSIYVKKLQDVEQMNLSGSQTLADREWMKKFLHLGGGTRASEQSAIRNNLRIMEETISNSQLGGDVEAFFKTSSDPIENSRQQAIFDRINDGTAVITFYGHSSNQGFDFSIDDPDNYRNFARYPYMISLGCYSGDAFTEARSISERFLFYRDKGAIAFGASKGVGFVSALGEFGRVHYDMLGNDYYGQGIGDALRGTIEHFSETRNWTIRILLEQYFLSGDPAYRMFPRPGPDLVIDEQSVRFSPEVVPASETIYEMDVRVVNLGAGTTNPLDSVMLTFRQELPDGSVEELRRLRIAVPDFDNRLQVRLPNLGIPAVGQNRIFVTVDSDRELAEAPAAEAEANNELVSGGQPGVPLTVIANTAKVAFPPPFATVGPGLELVASTTDPLTGERPYLIQIDTAVSFTRPLVDEVVNAPGGIIRFMPDLNMTDSTTYYWRISPDSTATEGAGYIWSESSFTFLTDTERGEEGWAAQHPGQTIQGEFSNIKAADDREGWNFDRTSTDIRIHNAVYEDRRLPRMEWNGQRFNSRFPWKIRTGIQVMVADSINNRDWLQNPGGVYGAEARPDSLFSFDTRSELGRDGLMRFLSEDIEEGKYVIIYSVQRGTDLEYFNEGWLEDTTSLGRTVFGVLEERGAQEIRRLTQTGSLPYVFVYQEGFGKISEGMAASIEETVVVNASIQENWQQGVWTSAPVGPSSGWRGLNLRFLPQEIGATDFIFYRLIGTTPNGDEVPLRAQQLRVQDALSYEWDLSDVESEQYPFLKVELDLSDLDERTVGTLEQLYFDYLRPGDAAVSPSVAFSAPDSLEQGQSAQLIVGYENVATSDMDSLLVELRLIDATNRVDRFVKRQPPLPAGGTGTVTFDIPTERYSSKVRMSMELNPSRDQREEVTFNNFLNSDVRIGRDQIAPDLQVFFDGRRISEGELVSGRPEILIQLRDENDFLQLNDTTGYTLQLTDPNGQRERIPFSDERIDFLPADGGDGENLAEIYFRPELLLDGNYELAVQGQDRSGNISGRLDFRQSFEVINEQRISNVLTYPNPFTTQTRFVYTLTGTEPPKTFRIQIMTVSGRVVRDIDLLALENLRIGTHQTDFAWDGTDEYGDMLANGVYLYRVISGDADGNAIKKHDTGTDQYFKNEMGKVVILR